MYPGTTLSSELLLVGNPVYTASEDAQSLGSEYRIEVLKRVPQLVKLGAFCTNVFHPPLGFNI